MNLDSEPKKQSGIQWHVMVHGRERLARGRVYAWDNRGRFPGDERYVFQLITEGQIVYEDATGRYPVLPGDLLLFRHNEPSWYGSAEPLAQTLGCHWVQLGGAGVQEHAAELRRRHGSLFRVGTQSSVADALAELMRLDQPQARGATAVIARAVCQFITTLYEFIDGWATDRMRPAEKAITQLRQNPLHPWSLKHVAAEAGCSREYLTRLFREEVGMSPAAYLNAARTERALLLLRSTHLSVREIAGQAGFSSGQAMVRHVRRVTGVSPDLWRKRQRGDPQVSPVAAPDR